MCLAALWWARCREIYFCNTRFDAAAIGFDDAAIYDEICAPLEARKLPVRRLPMKEALRVFQLWQSDPRKTPY
jgi:guanine deaminase